MHFGELTAAVRESDTGSKAFRASARALAEAAYSARADLASAATHEIFSEVVEPWADSFKPAMCDRYVAFMAEALYAPGSPAAAALSESGYSSPEQLKARYRRILAARPVDRERVRKVILLSRVTLGADIAVTSTVAAAALQAFPNAAVEFVGPTKNASLLGLSPRFHGRSVPYGRRDSLGERLAAWPAVRAAVEQTVEGLGRDEWIVVDPDSRLTQLGLLPVAAEERCRFFASRSGDVGNRSPLGSLAAAWCAEQWGIDPHAVQPRIELDGADRATAERIKAQRSGRMAAVSFGFGGRAAKRLGAGFEDGLLELLRQRGYRVVLDYGAGEDEERLVNERIRAFEGLAEPFSTAEDWLRSASDLATWKGSLQGFGAWVAAADVYVGYDSAAAHLAAALSVPVIEAFAGAPSELMRDRWTPHGPGPVTVLPVDGPGAGRGALEQVARALAALEESPGLSEA